MIPDDKHDSTERPGGIRYGLVALLLGLPLPFVILAFLMPGCN